LLAPALRLAQLTALARLTAPRAMAAMVERVGYAVHEKGQALRALRFKVHATPGDRELDILVTHNGLCHTDLHMRDDDWHISGYPFIPGHEVVGVVQAVGAGVSSSCAKVGQRVGVGWLKDSCRCCSACVRGEENLCAAGYTDLIVGAKSVGGFVDILRVPADFAFALPDALPSAAAAPLLCAGLTVYAPLARWVRPGARVAVVGIGGLGHLALQFCNALGGVATAVDIDASKQEEALRFGAVDFIHLQDFLANAAQPGLALCGRYDVILNTAAASLEVAPLLRALANNGTLVQLGLPGGDVKMAVPLLDLVFGQKRVVGSVVGGRAEMRAMLDLAAAKDVRPQVELAKLSDVNAQMTRVTEGKARYRVVMETD